LSAISTRKNSPSRRVRTSRSSRGIFEFKMPCSCGRSGLAPTAQAVRELSGALEMNPRHHSKPWSCADPITME
jgi:hypothetical protein